MYQNKLEPTLYNCTGPKYYVSGFLFIGWTVRGIFGRWKGHIVSICDTCNLCRHTFPQQSENEKKITFFLLFQEKYRALFLVQKSIAQPQTPDIYNQFLVSIIISRKYFTPLYIEKPLLQQRMILKLKIKLEPSNFKVSSCGCLKRISLENLRYLIQLCPEKSKV